MLKSVFKGAAALLLCTFITPSAAIPNLPNLGSHDPSRLSLGGGGTAWCFWSTSDDLTGWCSTNNGASWQATPRALPNGIPADVHAACPTNNGHNIWAPDLIWNPNTNLWHMYYSCANWDDGTYNAIGMVTSPTLDPARASWANGGVIIAKSPSANTYNAIDPAPFFDADGNMWMVFGSGFGSTRDTAINVIPLNRNTGRRSGSALHVVWTGSWEGAYIHYRYPYYYLFMNTGSCCSGASSTYAIHVARSSSPNGGFGGRRVFDDASQRPGIHGPGHMGIVTDGGVDYYTYHYYPDSGGSVVGMGRLAWTSDGWPYRLCTPPC